MRLDDETETGFTLTYAKKRTYALLVVSPTNGKGFVDYGFTATKMFPHRWHKIYEMK